jgi:hypothetical protein
VTDPFQVMILPDSPSPPTAVGGPVELTYHTTATTIC